MPRAKSIPPNRLYKARKALGLTQAQMGDLLGVTRITLQAYENGYQPISKRLADMLDIIEAENIRAGFALVNARIAQHAQRLFAFVERVRIVKEDRKKQSIKL